jgi:hypothetical protein
MKRFDSRRRRAATGSHRKPEMPNGEDDTQGSIEGGTRPEVGLGLICDMEGPFCDKPRSKQSLVEGEGAGSNDLDESRIGVSGIDQVVQFFRHDGRGNAQQRVVPPLEPLIP